MKTYADPFCHLWHDFWEDLDAAECVWAKQYAGQNGIHFERTIEAMLETSLTKVPLQRLVDLWSSCQFVDSVFDGDDADWNVFVHVERSDPFLTTPEEAERLLSEIARNQPKYIQGQPHKAQTLSVAEPFVRELKHVALCVVWDLNCSWSSFTAMLPHRAMSALQERLFHLAMLVVLRHLGPSSQREIGHMKAASDHAMPAMAHK